jgi:hypothetical protein
LSSKALLPWQSKAFSPLAIEDLDQRIAERVMHAHFDNEDKFRAPLPIPSLPSRKPPGS